MRKCRHQDRNGYCKKKDVQKDIRKCPRRMGIRVQQAARGAMRRMRRGSVTVTFWPRGLSSTATHTNNEEAA